MQSTVILSSALLLAFLAAPVLSLSVPTAKRSANELQLIPKIPDQPVDSDLAKRDINPGKYSSLCYLSPKLTSLQITVLTGSTSWPSHLVLGTLMQ